MIFVHNFAPFMRVMLILLEWRSSQNSFNHELRVFLKTNFKCITCYPSIALFFNANVVPIDCDVTVGNGFH